MTTANIETMSTIVDYLAEGKKFSKVLRHVYNKRHFFIPLEDIMLDVGVDKLKMSNRVTNALMRAHMRTIQDVVDYCNKNKILTIKALGVDSGIEIFEAILDYCWNNMDNDARTRFLIDVVTRNAANKR